MKKLIALFGSLTLVLSSSTVAVSCSKPNQISQKKVGRGQKTKNTNSHDVKHAKFDLIESEEQMFVGGLTKGIDGSFLSANNTISDAFDLIQNNILIDCPEAEDIKIINESKMNDNLKVGKNTIDVSYKLKNHNKKIKAVIRDVQTVDTKNMIEDHTAAKSKIEQIFKSGLSASHLYGWNTIFDALNFFKAEAKKINKDANVRFTGDWINKRMSKEIKKLAEEKLEIEGEKEAKTFSSILQASAMESKTFAQKTHDWFMQIFGLDSWVGTGQFAALTGGITAIFAAGGGPAVTALINNGARLGKVIVKTTWNGTKKVAKSIYSWISDKLHETKFKKTAFLKAGNAEIFDLHVFFDNDGDEIKNYLTENVRDHKPEQFVQAALKDIQPRSRENAKKIIEHETYMFTHPYTYEEVLREVENHIKNKMFPDDEETDKFEFKAVFKNKNDAKKELEHGLNRIELVLNPKKTFINFFAKMFGAKKPLDLILKVEYK